MFKQTGTALVVRTAAILLACLSIPGKTFSQFKNHGTGLYIAEGSILSVKSDFVSTEPLQGSGLLLLSGDSAQNLDMNGQAIPSLIIQNINGVHLTGSAQIGRLLGFETGNLFTENQQLILSDSSEITGYNESQFIVTNGSGSVVKKQLGPANFNGFLFPIGFSTSEYNPIEIANGGQTDDLAVRSTADPYDNLQASNNHFARCGWVVQEAVRGGSDISMRAIWRNQDEPPGFIQTKSGIAHYRENRGWDLPASGINTPAQGAYFTQTRNHIDSLGYFAIADSALANRARLHLRAFLQGAYMGNGITPGLMRDDLRSSQSIPEFQPYNGGLFAHVGLQGGTEMVHPSVFNAGANPANDIVDWIFVSLLNPFNTEEVFQTRAALLQRDGDIVDLDGTSDLSIPINEEGNYLVGIGHRNHLRIRTPDTNPLFLTTGPNATEWNFSTGNNQAYQNPGIVSNTPMIAVTHGGEERYCLIGGNTDGLTQINRNARSVIYSGAGNDRTNILVYALNGNPSNVAILNTHNYEDIGAFDLNMDGRIIYFGNNSDPEVILNALGGDTSLIAREHF